jgi:hypothetical protein
MHLAQDDDDEEGNALKSDSDTTKQEKRKEIHCKLLVKIERKRRTLQKCIDTRDAENRQLKERIQEMLEKTSVLNERKISTMKSMKKKEDDSEEKMKYITERLKLVSQMKQQDEEIEKLKSELARLKRRTFPIFPDKAAPKKSSNPDEKD